MDVKVTRYGGPMAMKPKIKSFDLQDLDSPTQRALRELLEGTSPADTSKRMPDGFVYSFEIEEAGSPQKTAEVNGTEVPDALRKLLP